MRKILLAAVMGLFASAAMAASTIDPSVPAASGPLTSAPLRQQFLRAFNDIQGIENCFESAVAPGTPLRGQCWLDTSVSVTVQTLKRYDGASWVTEGTLDTVNHVLYLGNSTEQTIASATTTDLGTLSSFNATISGTATITAFGTKVPAGQFKYLTFSGAATLTHNATSLILPGGANIVTVANDTALAKSLGSGNWQILWYTRGFGARSATRGFLTATTIAGNASVILTGGSFTSANVGDRITILGAGPNEQRYVGQIATVSASDTITVSPAPTLTLSAFSTIVYYGPDSAAAINAAFAAGAATGTGSILPPGTYMVASAVTCPVPNVNNFNVPPVLCGGSPGAVLMAAAAMPAVLTIGGFANTGDFTQYIRNSPIPGNGLTIDCNFIASDGFYEPFSQQTYPDKFQVKNCLKDYFNFGSPKAPTASGGITAIGNNTTRDIYYVPISGITSANPAIVTTSQDHGFPSGPPYRIAVIAGANNVPSPGLIAFVAEATGARTLKLHVDGSGWAAFSGSASLALTAPTTSLPHTVFAVTAGANPTITTEADMNYANGKIVCMTGIGGTGTLTGVPDGCYPIFSVGGVGGDGPTTFRVLCGCDSTGFTFTGGGVAYIQNNLTQASFTGSVGTTKLTVTAVSSGALEIGHQIDDATAGVTANTFITGSAYFSKTLCSPDCTGTGGTGTYAVNNSQTVSSRSLSTSVAGDVDFYLNNMSDAQFIANVGGGGRYGFLHNPATSGYDGRYIANHMWLSMEQGWMVSGHTLGGKNALIGEQCDGPIIFCAQFTGTRNTATAFLNANFLFLKDQATWMYRLENGADLTVMGGSMNGASGSIRASELSSYAMRGNQTIPFAQANYRRFGFAPDAPTTLYSMFDNSGTGATCLSGVTAGTVTVNGGIVTHC